MHGRLILLLLGIWTLIAGCGTPAAPAPPSLNLPVPVANLTAARTGNVVRLTWSMPTRTTDQVMLLRPVTVEVCRAVQAEVCTAIGSLQLEPGKPGDYADELPAPLTQGPEQLLHYEIALRNHAGKSAGPSNLALSAAGMSPPPLTGLTAQVRREGVLLGWLPVSAPGPAFVFRIHRVRLSTGEPEQPHKTALAAPLPPVAETLIVRSPDGRDPGHAMDPTAIFNQQYRYTVERVAMPVLGGKTIELVGPPSETIVVATTDTFPPAVPQGLAAVADQTTSAIDLSWTPDADNDLATYYVYRRDLRGDAAAQRMAPVGLETSFRDAATQPGHTYAYSVAAVDQSGNESQRCAEVEETAGSPSTPNN